MNKSDVTKQLELYSNAIVGFMVFQGLAYCYTFGTNERLNSVIKAKTSLSVGLAALFLVTTLLALFANHFLRQRLEALSTDYRELIKALYFGKAVVIAIFGALPFIVTVRYAIFGT